MNYLALAGDSLILIGLMVGTSLVKEESQSDFKGDWKKRLIYGLGIVFTIFSVYFRYRGQENSDYFFWHPYLAWTAGNIVYIILLLCRKIDIKKIILENVLLWQIVVIPVFSGLALSIGWLMKLYIR